MFVCLLVMFIGVNFLCYVLVSSFFIEISVSVFQSDIRLELCISLYAAPVCREEYTIRIYSGNYSLLCLNS